MLEYYDSDEDVYWGPVTLKESKQDILRKVAPDSIQHRRTIGCNPSFTNDQPKRFEEVISTEDKFFNTNIPSNMSDSQNFIEKVAEVLEVTAPSNETSYFTAKDSAKATDTSATYFTLALSSSEGAKDNRYETGKHKYNDSVDSSISINDVVNISSDIDNSILDHSLNLKDPLTKQEVFSEDSMDKINSHSSNDSHNISSNSDCSTSAQNLKDSFTNQPIFSENDPNQVDESNSNNESKTHLNPNYIMDLSGNSDKINVSTSSEESLTEIGEFDINPLAKLCNDLEIIEEVDENSVQTDLVPKIEIISSSRQCRSLNTTQKSDHEKSSDDESFKFNDTLEEMERLLQEGLNYTMTSNKNSNKLDESHKKEDAAIPAVASFNSNNSAVKSVYLTPNIPSRAIPRPNHITATRTPSLLFPTVERTTVRLPLKQHPQKSPIPLKPPPKDRFKNIQSPVATYIKNSGKAPLLKTITPSKVSNKENNHNLGVTLKKTTADNSIVFPDVRYKTPKKKIVQTEDFKLPQSISKLIPLKANVAHHCERIGRKQLNKELIDGDLTIGTDSSLNSSQDVSILDRRTAFI